MSDITYKIIPAKLENGEWSLDNVISSEGWTFQIDSTNRFAQEYRDWLAKGNTPEPPDFPSAETQLREKRGQLLIGSDQPWSMADYSHPRKEEWLAYRQALRDLPANSPNAALDENGNLIGVTWPTPPE